MQLTVSTLAGEEVTVDASPTDKVWEVKKRVARELNLNPRNIGQLIMESGQSSINESKTLGENGISTDARLMVTIDASNEFQTSWRFPDAFPTSTPLTPEQMWENWQRFRM